MLRESCSAASAPLGEHLTSREAKAILTLASSPEAGRGLSQDKIAAPPAPRRPAARHRGSGRADPGRVRAPQLEAHPRVVGRYAAAVRSLVAVIDALVTQVEVRGKEAEAGVVLGM